MIEVRGLTKRYGSTVAIEAVGYDAFCEALSEVMSPLHDRDIGLRVKSEFGWISAEVG